METITLTQLKEMCANHEHVSLVKGYYGKDLKYYGLESEPPKIIDLVFDWNEPFEHYVYGFGSVNSYMVYFRDAIGKKHHLQNIEDRKRKAIETINKEIEKLEEIKEWYSD